MKDKFIGLLGAIYTRIPRQYRPAIKWAVFGVLLRLQSLATFRRIRKGRRVEFLDFDIAHLEPFETLEPDSRQILVESICSTVSPGTERAVLSGLPGARRSFPYEPGYSCAGAVVKVGKKVSEVEPGDRVVGRMKHTSFSVRPPGGLFKVPDGVSGEEASFMELGIIVLQGIRKARIRPGDRVAVVGQGLIGQLANKFARLAGAGRVIAVAQSRRRESTALGPGGADEYIALAEDSGALDRIQADVVIEAVGSPQAVVQSIQCAVPGGRVILLGSSRGIGRGVDFKRLAQDRSIDIVGAHISAMPDRESSPGRWTYQQEGELFLRLLAEHRISVSDLVTWRAAPSECNQVFETLAAGGAHHVGIVFQWKPE
ncbi:MAG: zinc-binding alcohol dehydrogenase [Acidobacteria bacterium]|uniref:Zinc-binding alcohol dehydrogenase n=1 Tax=Candidatus Polarisedimenticola svalbardensis TaxID=2886004 RepID=A0A8J6Y611_9BACT|nr:zinc-binding alcohol dehydrogenase [Candidatus Polarisedimenticola svalbardensis]